MEFMKVLLNLNFFYKILGDKNKRIFLYLVLGILIIIKNEGWMKL